MPLLQSIPEEDREVIDCLDLDIGTSASSSMVKTLGVLWNPKLDVFVFKVAVYGIPGRDSVTRRHVLFETAKIFDPLGFLCPTIMVAKIMLQSCWTCCWYILG